MRKPMPVSEAERHCQASKEAFLAYCHAAPAKIEAARERLSAVVERARRAGAEGPWILEARQLLASAEEGQDLLEIQVDSTPVDLLSRVRRAAGDVVNAVRYRIWPCCALRFLIDGLRCRKAACLRGVSGEGRSRFVPCGWFHKPERSATGWPPAGWQVGCDPRVLIRLAPATSEQSPPVDLKPG